MSAGLSKPSLSRCQTKVEGLDRGPTPLFPATSVSVDQVFISGFSEDLQYWTEKVAVVIVDTV